MQFPRTMVGGMSIPRLLIGSNWLMGWSHRTSSADQLIKSRYPSAESMFPMFEAYMQYGIDAVMGPVTDFPLLTDAVHYAEDKLGKKIIIIDTPFLNVDDSVDGRREIGRAHV